MELFLALSIPMIMIRILGSYTVHGEGIYSGKLTVVTFGQYLVFATLLFCMTIGSMVDKLMLSCMFIAALVFTDFLHLLTLKLLCRIIPISWQGVLEGFSRCVDPILIPCTLYATVYVADLIIN